MMKSILGAVVSIAGFATGVALVSAIFAGIIFVSLKAFGLDVNFYRLFVGIFWLQVGILVGQMLLKKKK